MINYIDTNLNNGIPKPMMNTANISEQISVINPNFPVIIDCSIFSDTSGIDNAPSTPTEIYNRTEIIDEFVNTIIFNHKMC